MKYVKIPADFCKSKSEKMKKSLIELIEMIKEGRIVPMSEKPPAEWLIRMNTFWKSKMEEARDRGDMLSFSRAKEEMAALDNFYGKPPIKPKAGTETRDVCKIDLVKIYGDEVKPYKDKGYRSTLSELGKM